MEIGEEVAVRITLGQDVKCPFEPHVKSEYFEQKKRCSEKNVEQLRKNMKAGRSTRTWIQTNCADGDEKFRAGENTDGHLRDPKPALPKEPITIRGISFPLSQSAHHLIPGKESLPVSSLRSLIWKQEGGKILGDIGYDVDGAENGMWLPTHQVMSSRLAADEPPHPKYVIHDDEDASEAMTWAALAERAKGVVDSSSSPDKDLFLLRYTQQSMELSAAQFHDSHDDYSQKVARALDGIHVFLLNRVESVGCGACLKNDIGPMPPPHMLVHRLNALSHTMRIRLAGSPNPRWRIWFTSQFARLYAQSPLAPEILHA